MEGSQVQILSLAAQEGLPCLNDRIVAGAAAVVLLTKGLGGNTIVKIRGTKIYYKPTAEVIKQRHVDLNTVSFYEKLGICFGRQPGEFTPELVEEKGAIEREF